MVAKKKFNPNYVLQMPCDGIALNVMEKYAFGKDIINYVEGVNFPRNFSGRIDCDRLRKETEEYLSKFISDTTIGRVFFNVSYTRAATPSDCMDTFAYNVDMSQTGDIQSDKKQYLPLDAKGYPGFRYFAYTLREGIDLIQYGIDYVRRMEIEPWVSIRMNDHHAPNNPVINAHYRIEYANSWGIGGKANKMDYLVPAVRKVQLNYITELCEKYDISGVELDFLRSNPYVSTVDEDSIRILNDFIKTVRKKTQEIAEKKGKNIKLAVRVFATEDINIKIGLDVSFWLSQGWIDVVTVANFFQPVSFDLPIEEWRKSIEKRNCGKYKYVLLGGLDWGVMSSPLYHLPMDGDYTRGFVSSVLANGGDGIYLFNTFNLNGRFATGYKIQKDGSVYEYNNFEDRKKAGEAKDAENKLRRYAFSYFTTDTDEWRILPITLQSGEEYTFDMQTGSAPERGFFMAVVPVEHEDAHLTAYLNGKQMREANDMRRSEELPYIPANLMGVNEVKHITQIGKRILQFLASNLTDVKNGRNRIVIKNMGKKAETVVWFEIFVDNRKNADPMFYDK